jgi:uncharacterized protein YdeI (YjbR/CyaY-like superfamily)
MVPIFFNDKTALRTWFERNHLIETVLLVGYYTVKSKKKSITWSQSVDEAICFGWIDGIRKSIDDESYCIRFTPRRPGSNWSKINLSKARDLTQKGLMLPAGLEAFSKRKDKDHEYSYESGSSRDLDISKERLFRQHKRAWSYFLRETPSYQKITIRWIMSAKQETTRMKRLHELIAACEAEDKISAMKWGRDR